MKREKVISDMTLRNPCDCHIRKSLEGRLTRAEVDKPVRRLCSIVILVQTPCTAACQASLFFIVSWSLFKLISIESVMPSNYVILCLLLLLLSSIFPNIMVFSNELALCIRWPKYLELQLQHQSFQ